MPSWKKLITSGSDASLTSLTVTNGVTGSLFGTASWALNAITASYSTATSENKILVINKSGATITKGMVVHLTGSNNSSDTPYVITASYQSDQLSANTLGVAAESITFNSTGYVTTEGVITGLNVTGLVSGQLVYLGNAGSITGSAPVAPLHAVRLGQVVRDAPSNNGAIYVRVDNGYELGELHDIIDTSTTSSFGDLLVKSGSVWINTKQLSGSYGLTGSLNINGTILVTGSATIGAVSAGASENSLTLGARDTVNEGGQIGFNAPGGTYTSASFIDNWQNKTRILKGNNTTSTGLIAQWDIHTTQMQLAGYTGASSFPGTATANLAVDSGGNVITVSTSGGSVFPYTGTAGVTGSISATGAIYSQVNGGMYFQGGDDAALHDINVSNTMGIYGVQNSTVGAIKLGSAGPVLYGSGSSLGIGTTTPTLGTLQVNGNVYATSFTGSLFGTASWATNVVGGIGVTSVATSGTVSGITLTGGTITSTGTITLGGSISGLTNSNLSGTAGITNANLANSSITIAGNSTALGGSVTQAQILAGSGVWSGSAQLPSGVVSGSSQVSYTGLSNIPSGIVSGSAQITGLTNSNLSGTAGITNANLANSSITIAGTSTSLGGSISQATILAGSGVFSGSAQISGLTNSNLSGTAGITNANLANSSVTIGSTAISLGTTATTIAGLSSVTSTTFVGALTGTSSWATSVVNTASNATAAATINVTLDNATNASYYPVFTSGISGNQVARVDNATLTYNPGTNTLTTSTFVGALTGTSSWATNVVNNGVTSVATAGTVSGITLTGGTITSTGTITLGGTISGLTNANLSGTAGISNANLANNNITIGATTIALGSSATSIGGLSSVTSTTFTGALNGNASTATSASFASTASFLNGSTTNAFIQSGNSFGATAVLGTNDNQSLALETNGTTKMFISSSGNVGLNTAAPETKLHIEDVTKTLTGNVAGVAQGTLSLVSTDAQAADVGASLVFGGNYINASQTKIAYAGITGRKSNASSVNADGYLSFLTWRSTGLTEAMRVSAAGYVGIGTVTPSSQLHTVANLSGPVSFDSRAAIYGNNTSTDATYANSIGVAGKVSTTSGMAIYGDAVTGNGYAGYFMGRGYFSGSVGIGTATPSSRLDVTDTVSMPTLRLTNPGSGGYGGGGYIDIVGGGTDYVSGEIRWINGATTRGSIGYAAAGRAMTFKTEQIYDFQVGGSTKMYMNSTGQLGIGTTTLNETFTVAGSTLLNGTGTGLIVSASQGLALTVVGGNNSNNIASFKNVTNNTVVASVNPSGIVSTNAGLNYNSSVSTANVNGEIAYWGAGSVTAGDLYYYDSTGTWTAANANAAATATNMLGIAQATGTASSVGMLLRGHARFTGNTNYTGVTTVGAPLYIKTTAGGFSQTAPTTSTHIVRVIGYVQSTSNDQIYFCPDNTWVELA